MDFIIRLKTENWLNKVFDEISLCTTNCVSMCEYIDISTNDDYNNIGIPTTSDTSRSKPPTRPPLPKSPQPTQKAKHQVWNQHFVISIKKFNVFSFRLAL